MDNNTILLSSKDAAKTLAISERSLYALTREGRIPCVRIGRRCIRYDRADLQAFVQQCKGATL